MLRLNLERRVARVTLEHAPVNAVGDAWLAAFHEMLDALAARSDWHVLHLASSQKVY
jgi:hypothetical protein